MQVLKPEHAHQSKGCGVTLGRWLRGIGGMVGRLNLQLPARHLVALVAGKRFVQVSVVVNIASLLTGRSATDSHVC